MQMEQCDETVHDTASYFSCAVVINVRHSKYIEYKTKSKGFYELKIWSQLPFLHHNHLTILNFKFPTQNLC